MSEATAMQSISTPTPAPDAPAPLVRHSRKEEWGRALLLWRREEKRAYQFEDGRMRVFAERFSNLLRPARHPDPALRHRLRERAVADGHIEATAAARAAAKAGPRPTIADQMVLFESEFEGGFYGDAWTDAARCRPGKKALKRHRDAAIKLAGEKLGADGLRAMIDAGNPGEAVRTVLDVVASTDLATKSQIEVFRKLDADEDMARALVDFLHDVQGGGERGPLNRLRMALAKVGLRKVPWTTLTAARALLQPQTHVFVRPSVFRAQAKLSAPGFKLSSVPTPEVYARCLELVLGVRAELERAGFRPRDLFDVVGFMKATTSRSKKQELIDAMGRRVAEETDTPMAPQAPQKPTVH